MATIQYIIADDHRIFRQGLRFSLSKDKTLLCIGEAGNGTELMQLLETMQPDVILMDLKMPKVDGLEVLRRVKSHDRLRMIPVVLLSSSKEDKDIFQSYLLGVNSYVVKPVEFEGLLKTVQGLGLYWLLLNQTCKI